MPKEILAGQHGHVNYEAIASVVYTMPEIASVGATEEELQAKGVAYRTGKFPFVANSRARAMRRTDGFVKILADAASTACWAFNHRRGGGGTHRGGLRVDGVRRLGGGLARTCHAHPTLSEAVRKAALAVDKRAIHM